MPRLVLRSTLLLIVLGAVGLLFTERFAPDGLINTLSLWEKLQVTIFQSITTRTAGFNTVPLSIETLSEAGLLLMIVLMFIGASPGGTGGGIKTTTFAVLMGATRSTLEDRKEVIIRKHEIPGDIVLKAVGVALASGLFVILMTLLLGLGPTAGGEPSAEAYSFLEKLFVHRQARLFDYAMSPEERSLYDDVTRYLLEPGIQGFRGRQRQLLLLGFHRLLASSPRALAGGLELGFEGLELGPACL